VKKIVLNISDALYEKFRFEAIEKRKSVPDVIAQAVTEKTFTVEVEHAYNEWLEKNIIEMMSK
jgi:hypothetical protein